MTIFNFFSKIGMQGRFFTYIVWSKNYAFKTFRVVLLTVDVRNMFLEIKEKLSTPVSVTADLTRLKA